MDPRVTVVMTLQTSSMNMQALNVITACKLYMYFFQKVFSGLFQVARSWLWLAYLCWFWYVVYQTNTVATEFVSVIFAGTQTRKSSSTFSDITFILENLKRWKPYKICFALLVLVTFLMFPDLTCFGWLLQASEAELEEFFVECNFYSLASHLYWGIWAIVQVNFTKFF